MKLCYVVQGKRKTSRTATHTPANVDSVSELTVADKYRFNVCRSRQGRSQRSVEGTYLYSINAHCFNATIYLVATMPPKRPRVNPPRNAPAKRRHRGTASQSVLVDSQPSSPPPQCTPAAPTPPLSPRRSASEGGYKLDLATARCL
jgi:hypothetical protein